MASTLLIRSGGVAAIAGGLAATSLGLLYVLRSGGVLFGPAQGALQRGHYENPVLGLLLVGSLAAIAALHAAQRDRYGSFGGLAALAAFAGAATVLVGGLLGESGLVAAPVAFVPLGAGVLIASVGIVGLGVATALAGVLPWWCGAALVAGSPPGVAVTFMLCSRWVASGVLPGEIGWTLAGVPWAVVGYALFRVASTHQQQPSRAARVVRSSTRRPP